MSKTTEAFIVLILPTKQQLKLNPKTQPVCF